MAVTEAVENYLETILVLSYRQPDVHAVDIWQSFGIFQAYFICSYKTDERGRPYKRKR